VTAKLTLHHDASTPDTLKLLIALGEAGADFAHVLVDVASLAHWRSPHRDIAPDGEVPVLVVDGDAFTDSTHALEYVAEALAPGRLAPVDALGWYKVQAWLNKLDGVRGPVNLLGWNLTTAADERARYRSALAQVEGRKRLAGWSAVVEDAEVSEDQLQVARDRIAEIVDKVEAQLGESAWLAGETYSIADIAGFGLLRGLPRLVPEIVTPDRTPRLLEWLDRIAARPAVRDATGSDGTNHYAPPT
jgi:glutathione S-transferase